MTIKNLFAFVLAITFLAGCSKPKPADLNGQTMYLTSTNLHESPYVQMAINFKGHQVEIFEIKRLKPMFGDVVVGDYWFTGDQLNLPRMGQFSVKQTAQGLNLYSAGRLQYRLSKKEQPFIKATSNSSQRFAAL